MLGIVQQAGEHRCHAADLCKCMSMGSGLLMATGAVQAIFRMNQKQLEVAMRRVWNDSSLEAKRKAYLMQHIMASR